jgi:hypothetical protein
METHSLLLGFLTFQIFIVMWIFSQLGLAVNLLLHSNTRNQNSPNTPVKFKLWFLIRDNWKSIIFTELIILLTIRFAQILIPEQFRITDLQTPAGIDMWLFGSVVIGFCYNKLAQYWKDKSQWLKVKRPVNGT